MWISLEHRLTLVTNLLSIAWCAFKHHWNLKKESNFSRKVYSGLLSASFMDSLPRWPKSKRLRNRSQNRCFYKLFMNQSSLLAMHKTFQQRAEFKSWPLTKWSTGATLLLYQMLLILLKPEMRDQLSLKHRAAPARPCPRCVVVKDQVNFTAECTARNYAEPLANVSDLRQNSICSTSID